MSSCSELKDTLWVVMMPLGTSLIARLRHEAEYATRLRLRHKLLLLNSLSLHWIMRCYFCYCNIQWCFHWQISWWLSWQQCISPCTSVQQCHLYIYRILAFFRRNFLNNIFSNTPHRTCEKHSIMATSRMGNGTFANGTHAIGVVFECASSLLQCPSASSADWLPSFSY